jgi:hypothetical protein
MENGGEGRVWIKGFSRFFLSAKWGLLGELARLGARTRFPCRADKNVPVIVYGQKSGHTASDAV